MPAAPEEHPPKQSRKVDSPPGRQRDAEGLRNAGLALAIPSLMIAGPFAGLLLGRWLGGYVGHSDGAGLIGLALGFVASVREVIKIVRRLGK